jgi:hypothetical protein
MMVQTVLCSQVLNLHQDSVVMPRTREFQVAVGNVSDHYGYYSQSSQIATAARAGTEPMQMLCR